MAPAAEKVLGCAGSAGSVEKLIRMVAAWVWPVIRPKTISPKTIDSFRNGINSSDIRFLLLERRWHRRWRRVDRKRDEDSRLIGTRTLGGYGQTEWIICGPGTPAQRGRQKHVGREIVVQIVHQSVRYTGSQQTPGGPGGARPPHLEHATQAAHQQTRGPAIDIVAEYFITANVGRKASKVRREVH